MFTDAAIDFRGLTKDYGAVRALDGVSLSVSKGEVFGYVGPNGAGKTTTIKILAGLARPTAGDAFICGRSILTEQLEVKARTGYIPESGALLEKLTPREFLTSIGRLYRLPDCDIDAQLARWLNYFGLRNRADQRIGLLSKGNKQKICWISSLLHDPEVFILDEPLNGLDAETISRVKELMSDLVLLGKTIFYSSHLIDIVEKVCTRIAVLDRGTLVGVGTVEQIREMFNTDSLEQALLRLWRRGEQEA